MKRQTEKKRTPSETVKAMLAESERAVSQLGDDVERQELDAYLDGDNINGTMVDDSMDIEPEQVALLGAYGAAVKIRDSLKAISEGKEPVEEQHISKGVIALELDAKGNIKSHEVFGDVPPKALEQIKAFLNKHDLNKLMKENEDD